MQLYLTYLRNAIWQPPSVGAHRYASSPYVANQYNGITDKENSQPDDNYWSQ